MAMIPHHPTAGGGGAMVAAAAARGFGGALFQSLRGAVSAAPPPQVTVQVPAGALDAASTAAIVGVATQLGSEIRSLITQITPYCKFGFYTFMILVAIVILEKVEKGPLGTLVKSAAKALIAIGRAGAPHAKSAIVRFVYLSARLLKAIPSAIKNSVFERASEIQNYVGHKVASVRAAVTATRAYVASTKAAVLATAMRTLARVRAAGVRVKTAVGGLRARMTARRKARNNRAMMQRTAKIRANLAAINKRVTANEEARIQRLVNKVKKTSEPLTARERREYLAMVHRAERNAKKNVAMINAAQTLAGLGRRRRSH
jgi:hypothetical protein